MDRRTMRWAVMVGALMIGVAGVMRVNASQTAIAAPPCGINLRLLVVSADRRETGLTAIRQTLDYLGTPYDLFVATERPALTAADLTSGCTGRYQGVILATGELTYEATPGSYVSAFAPDEFSALTAYESLYRVRRLVWYAYPSPALGFQWPTWPGGASSDPVTATFTPAAAAIFAHVNRSNPLRIVSANTYLTYHAQALDSTSVPLLTDADGHALAALQTTADGRQTLALTFDSNQYLTHSLVLAYDLVNWVTKGIFIGQRHAYLSPQVDDIFIHDQMWSPSTPCGTPVDATTSTYRLTGADFTSMVTWQRSLQAAPLTKQVRLTMGFNGEGTTGMYAPDDLTPAAVQYKLDFHWVSHTWDHDNLDAATVVKTAQEVNMNYDKAVKLNLKVDKRNLITPDVSGLKNPKAIKGLFQNGVRYIVTDTSQPGYNNPTPNTGLWNEYQTSLFMIPRYPSNLYFNVSTPAEWVAEYNCMYRGFWGRDLVYREILDTISNDFVRYLLKGDMDLLMFHQPNLRAYDGRHSLLGDLIDTTIAKYSALVTFPIASPPMNELGDMMMDRETFNASGVTATLIPGQGLVITAVNKAEIPITGLNWNGPELYAGQTIAHVNIGAGRTKTIPIPVAAQ